MNILVQKLPYDIVQQIIPYTYQPQTKSILYDIQHYLNTKSKLILLYKEYWVDYIGEQEPNHKYWFINDLFSFANENKVTMYGYVPHFYNIFYRNPSLKTIEQINKYISLFDKRDIDTQINIFWAILTPLERDQFTQHSYYYL